MRCKSATSSRLLLLALGLAAIGCGDKRSTLEPNQKVEAPRPALESDVPVLRWFPPKADLAVVAPSLEEFLVAARQLASSSPDLDLSILGEGRWDPKVWSQRGIVESAPIGLFVSGASVTAVLPTLESGTLSAWANQQSAGQVTSSKHRGHVVSSTQRGPAHWSWLEVDGNFLLHLAARGGNAPGPGLPWLDAVLDASEGSAYSATQAASDAFDHRKSGEVWGSASPLALLGTAFGGTEYLACVGLLAKLEGIGFGASLQGQTGKVRSFLTLSEDGAATLRGLQTEVASEAMQARRESAGLYASLALDLVTTSDALRVAECPELAEVLRNPLATLGWSPPPRAIHVAGTHFNPDKLSGNVALDVALRSKRFVSKQLGRVPGRSFFETSMTIQGTRVKRLSIPTMSSLYYHLSNQRLVFGTSKSLMTALLQPDSQPPSESAELMAGGLWPQRIKQLKTILRQVISGAAERKAVLEFLGSVHHAKAAVHLKGNRLELELELELLTEVSPL